MVHHVVHGVVGSEPEGMYRWVQPEARALRECGASTRPAAEGTVKPGGDAHSSARRCPSATRRLRSSPAAKKSSPESAVQPWKALPMKPESSGLVAAAGKGPAQSRVPAGFRRRAL